MVHWPSDFECYTPRLMQLENKKCLDGGQISVARMA
jgi:hypothetical protein